MSHPKRITYSQNYSYVYLNLYILEYQIGRQKILHRMLASIP
jgi:hypothetical protein